jgi:hypothetical protein
LNRVAKADNGQSNSFALTILVCIDLIENVVRENWTAINVINNISQVTFWSKRKKGYFIVEISDLMEKVKMFRLKPMS